MESFSKHTQMDRKHYRVEKQGWGEDEAQFK